MSSFIDELPGQLTRSAKQLMSYASPYTDGFVLSPYAVGIVLAMVFTITCGVCSYPGQINFSYVEGGKIWWNDYSRSKAGYRIATLLSTTGSIGLTLLPALSAAATRSRSYNMYLNTGIALFVLSVIINCALPAAKSNNDGETSKVTKAFANVANSLAYTSASFVVGYLIALSNSMAY